MVGTKRPSLRLVNAEQKRLISAAIDGDHDAARHLLGVVAPGVRDVVVRFLGRGHRDVDDSVQDALIALIRALPSYRSENSLLAYARRIALRRVLDNQMRVQHTRSGNGSEPTRTSSPELQGENARLRALIQRLIVALPSEQADAFAARHLLGLSVTEIAASLKISPNIVRSRLRLAKEALLERVLQEQDFAAIKEAFL